MPGRATPAMPAVLGPAGPGQQGVDQRVAVVVAGRRMDDEPGRLVDDEQVVVLVDDRELDVRRRREVQGDRLRDVEADLHAGRDDRVGAQGGPVRGRGQAALADELLDVAPRQPGGVGHDAVDPHRRPVRAPGRSGSPATTAASGIDLEPVRLRRRSGFGAGSAASGPEGQDDEQQDGASRSPRRRR